MLRVRVVDSETGAPVAGARIWALSGREGRREQDLSDEDGFSDVRIERSGRVVLLVLAEGFAAHEETLPTHIPEGRTVALAREGRIRGQVAWAGGEPLDSGLVALAWPSEFEPPAERVRIARELGHDGWIAAVPVAADGRFELRGLHANLRYTVSAGGPGCLVVKPPQGIQPGSSELQLTLSAIHGTAVVLEGDGGVPPAVDDALALEPTTVGGLTPEVQWLTAARWMPQLVLVGGESLLASVQRQGWSYSTYLFATDDPLGGVAFELSLELPGCAPTQRRLVAPRILGELEVQRVRIEDRLGLEGRGSLRVLFVGPGAALLRDGVSSSGGTRVYVSLLRAEELEDRPLLEELDNRPLLVALDLPQDDGRTIVGLPVGEYSAAFRFERGTWSPGGVASTVSILRGGVESLLVCDLGGFGLAVFEVIDEDGFPFEGRIQLIVGRETQRRSGTHYHSVGDAFQRGPYAFGPLVPGQYMARIDSFPGRRVRPGARITFEVVENGFAFPILALTDFLEP